MGFVKFLGILSVTIAKLWGLYTMMDIAWNIGWRKVHFELNSEVFVRMVSKRSHLCNPLVDAIRACIARAWKVEVTHCFQEANKVAD